MARATGILQLENKSELTFEQVKTLMKDYLIRLAEVPEGAIKEIDKNFQDENVLLKSGTTRSKNISVPPKSVSRYFSIEKAIDDVSQNLVESYYRKRVNATLKSNYPFFNTAQSNYASKSQIVQNYKTLQNIMRSESINNLIAETKQRLSLALARVFFDFDAGFSEKTLKLLASQLAISIERNDFDLSNKNFPKLYTGMQNCLNKIELPIEYESQPTKRPRLSR